MSAFSAKGLERLRRVLSRHVESGGVEGYVAAIKRRGELHVESSLARDTPFRITSMTKPITAVAVLMLLEECRFRLDDPVERWLPELADRRVLSRLDAPLDDTVAARRGITVRDLLTFRCGLGFGSEMMRREPTPFLARARELNLASFGPPDPSNPLGPEEWLKRLASLPLLHQPGEQWLYNTSAYILGILLERVTGKSLADAFREMIFEPLGMRRTAFRSDRLPSARRWDGAVADPAGAASAWAKQPAFLDAGAGLVSTLDDYLAFARMLLGFGRDGNGPRLLSRPSVEAMITDQLTPEQKARSGLFPGQFDGTGWGFGVGICTRRDDPSHIPDSYGWDGGFGTTWRNDPHERFIGVCLTQTMGSPRGSAIGGDFWQAAYAAFED